MTVSVNDRRIQYGPLLSEQSIFPYDFLIEDDTEITVLQNSTELTLTTDYTVDGVGNASGGNITFTTPAVIDDVITIIGNTPISRVTDFNQAGDFLMSDLNSQLDRLTNIAQEDRTDTDRSIKLKPEDTVSELEIPVTSERASKYLAFDADSNAIATEGSESEVPITSRIAERDTAVFTVDGIETYSLATIEPFLTI